MPAHPYQILTRGCLVLALALAAGQYLQSTAPQPLPVSSQLHLHPIKIETVTAQAEVVPKPPAKIQRDCVTSLDLAALENAMIAVTLVASCHPNERVVLKHAGLAITAKTTVTGAIFTDLPALTPQATVEVLFKDGSRLHSSLELPEAVNLRRFAVQWGGEDEFQLHGLEHNADFDAAGDISRTNPNTPAAGAAAKAGFLVDLGDSSTDFPLLAQVYTYPPDPASQSAIVVEAAVTKTSCGREMLGETLFSLQGQVVKADLTVAMPSCDAIGDYLLLNDLVPEMKIASSE